MPPSCPADTLELPAALSAWGAHFPVEAGGVGVVTNETTPVGDRAKSLGLDGVGSVDCGGRRVWWFPGVPCSAAQSLVEQVAGPEAKGSLCFPPKDFEAQAAPATTVDETPAPVEPPPPRRAIVASDLLPLAQAPERLGAMTDPQLGVTAIRVLDCEREEDVDQVQRACGDEIPAALAPLETRLARQVQASSDHPDEPGISCQTSPDNWCDVSPHNECEPTYRLYFDQGRLVAIVERDDWQSSAERKQERDTRIRQELAVRPTCGR